MLISMKIMRRELARIQLQLASGHRAWDEHDGHLGPGLLNACGCTG